MLAFDTQFLEQVALLALDVDSVANKVLVRHVEWGEFPCLPVIWER